MCCSRLRNRGMQRKRGSTQQLITKQCLKTGLPHLGYTKRLGLDPWGHSPSSANQTQREHTQTHGSVCWNHVSGDVSTPVLKVYPSMWLSLYPLLIHNFYIAQFIIIVPFKCLLILFVFRLKINHILSCNDCVFILVLGMDLNRNH
jgi:hypothetical protein